MKSKMSNSHDQSSILTNAYFLKTISILGGMAVQLMLGIIPAWGGIMIYVGSYFRALDPSISLQDMFLVYPFALIFGALFSQLGVDLSKTLKPKAHAVLGGGLLVLSIYISSFVQNFYLFLFTFGLMSGLALGLLYTMTLKNVYSHFPTEKQKVASLIMGSFYLGAVFWVIFC
mmetsp:Transcript_24975/g.24433  ORF Transcript_24975/g.24433 Transcript_24975/m.24433 type:complete len:173 (-) Transcript_24975:441-959(-)